MKSPDDLIRHVATHFGKPPAHITSPMRENTLAEIRGGIMVALRDNGQHSFPQIARIVGRTNHTTAMHWAKLADRGEMERRPVFAEAYRVASAFLDVDPWKREVPGEVKTPKPGDEPASEPPKPALRPFMARKVKHAAKFASVRAQSVHREFAAQAERQAKIRAMEYGA